MKKIEKNIVEYFQKIGWAAYVAGLQDTHSGNMSMRIGSRMLITRRGSMLGFLNGHDIIELSLEKNDSGISLASSEVGIHRAIYKETNGLAIVHAHLINAVILSFIYKEIVPIDVEASYTIKKVPVLSFELGSGSKEMEEEIPKFLKNNKIVVIKGHGAIGLGETLEEALFYNSVLENSCKIIMGIHSLGKNPEEFTPKEINRGW
ncbi:MAG: fuculose phosphate aldolase [Candidatus Atribacteria bacterium]|nr:fuculose phosphate aldolase [Candidatus Atribacteria bacterium]